MCDEMASGEKDGCGKGRDRTYLEMLCRNRLGHFEVERQVACDSGVLMIKLPSSCQDEGAEEGIIVDGLSVSSRCRRPLKPTLPFNHE